MTRAEEMSLAGPLADDVRTRRGSLLLADGHAAAVLRHSPPEPATRTPVLYVHGIQSHPGWFVGSAQALARAGHEVFQVTRRGSGLTAARRGDAASGRQLLGDVDAAVEHVRGETGSADVALLGVSWGGKLLTAYPLQAAAPAASLTLVAPGIAPRVDVPGTTKLAIAAARCLWPRKYFDIPLNDVSLFTDNPPMRDYLAADPLRLRRATARLLVTSALLDRTIARAPPSAIELPVTLILARRDRIIDNAATAEVLRRLTGGRANVVEIDAAHTIEFEPDPAAFHDALRAAVQSSRES